MLTNTPDHHETDKDIDKEQEIISNRIAEICYFFEDNNAAQSILEDRLTIIEDDEIHFTIAAGRYQISAAALVGIWSTVPRNEGQPIKAQRLSEHLKILDQQINEQVQEAISAISVNFSNPKKAADILQKRLRVDDNLRISFRASRAIYIPPPSIINHWERQQQIRKNGSSSAPFRFPTAALENYFDQFGEQTQDPTVIAHSKRAHPSNL